jgi:hypothetical protein
MAAFHDLKSDYSEANAATVSDTLNKFWIEKSPVCFSCVKHDIAQDRSSVSVQAFFTSSFFTNCSTIRQSTYPFEIGLIEEPRLVFDEGFLIISYHISSDYQIGAIREKPDLPSTATPRDQQEPEKKKMASSSMLSLLGFK